MRHRFHSICPYFAMFPEMFVRKHLAASCFDGAVIDPFCGRGTTIFEALLADRDAAGCDVHPVAVCITSAKCNSPRRGSVLKRLNELESHYFSSSVAEDSDDNMKEFFVNCFNEDTYAELKFLRSHLDWRRSKVDCFIAALCLGSLHGESHRSQYYFSNRMPRTISTKPDYSIRWWHRNGYIAPRRAVFPILRNRVDFRFSSPPPELRGKVVESDARQANIALSHLAGGVTDVITSPPYLDTTNYREDQWLRLWFLGEKANSSQPHNDGRHSSKDLYWKFLDDAWNGVMPLLSKKARIVVRIGGRKMSKDEMFEGLLSGIKGATKKKVIAADSGVSSVVRRTQANSFRGEKASRTEEHDFCFFVG